MAEWKPGKIRALRRHLGFSQEEMGQELGVIQWTISHWERGEHAPKGASVKLLDLKQRESGFRYRELGDG